MYWEKHQGKQKSQQCNSPLPKHRIEVLKTSFLVVCLALNNEFDLENLVFGPHFHIPQSSPQHIQIFAPGSPPLQTHPKIYSA